MSSSDVTPASENSVKPPAPLLVHLGLFAVQFQFGVNTVIGKLGLSGKTNPLFLSLLREAIAGPVLFAAAMYFERQFIKKKPVDIALFVGCGFALYANQLCYTVGLKFADSNTATVWQLTQPIFTVALALGLRMERVTIINIFGILLSIGGAVFMIIFGKTKNLSSQGAAGHICFFLNCFATSCYVITSKPLLKLKGYKPTTVIGLAYIEAACFMLCTNFIVDWWPKAINLICPKCEGEPFNFGPKAWGALASNVLLGSILSYSLMTWCNRWIYATIVSAYLVVQPLTAIILAVILNRCGVSGMDAPGYNDLGAIAIVAGLACIVGGNVYKDRQEAKRKAEEAEAAGALEMSQPDHVDLGTPSYK